MPPLSGWDATPNRSLTPTVPSVFRYRPTAGPLKFTGTQSDPTLLQLGYPATFDRYDTFSPYVTALPFRPASGQLHPPTRKQLLERLFVTELLTGHGPPSNAIGYETNVYMDLDTGDLYQKINGVW